MTMDFTLNFFGSQRDLLTVFVKGHTRQFEHDIVWRRETVLVPNTIAAMETHHGAEVTPVPWAFSIAIVMNADGVVFEGFGIDGALHGIGLF